MLNYINDFEGTYRMSEHSFSVLLEGIREDITLSFIHSSQSSSGNDPIYPELVLAMSLRFLVGDSIRVLSQLFGLSQDSCRRLIKMALNAIDTTDFEPLQIRLPQTPDEIHVLAQRWSSVSTSFGLFDGHLGALDGWLSHTERPCGVTNQAECAAAPGITNDVRAFGLCTGLVDWLDNILDQYFILGGNAYILSKKC